MDDAKIISSILSAVNDGSVVTSYGHGWLITTPMRFYDDDRVTLFVEQYERGIRVTDQGTTAMRLHMADVNLDSPKIMEAWRRSVAALGQYSTAAEAGVIAAWGESTDLGHLTLRVAEATMRVDQLRWISQERKPVRFTEQVVEQIRSSLHAPELVTPRAALPLRSGRKRQVTAAIGDDPDSRIYVQAVAGGNADSRERSVEHCAYLFHYALNIPRPRRIVVASGTRNEWPSEILQELSDVSEIAFFGERGDVARLVSERTHDVLPG
ncbi:DUF1828 domain-containing protein [Lentzea alba]|uniref:DUF1828 domain-containing protein n=1 Tax=Lentzea alba TaxID=2714351 RepID=UPI0039BFB3C9